LAKQNASAKLMRNGPFSCNMDYPRILSIWHLALLHRSHLIL